MQVLILSALLAVACATPLLGGTSAGFRSQDNAGNYAFGYNEGHATGGTFRRESGSNGVKVGSYGLTDADGRQRVVNYVADAAGFRADIKTNEPGVDASQDPAATTINKDLIVAGAAPYAAFASPYAAVAAPYAAVAAPAALHHYAAGVHHPGAISHYSSGIHHGVHHAAYAPHYAAYGYRF